MLPFLPLSTETRSGATTPSEEVVKGAEEAFKCFKKGVFAKWSSSDAEKMEIVEGISDYAKGTHNPSSFAGALCSRSVDDVLLEMGYDPKLHPVIEEYLAGTNANEKENGRMHQSADRCHQSVGSNSPLE